MATNNHRRFLALTESVRRPYKAEINAWEVSLCRCEKDLTQAWQTASNLSIPGPELSKCSST